MSESLDASKIGRRTGPIMLLISLAGLMGLVGLRLAIGERPLDATGPRALLDAGFALELLGGVLLIAYGWGQIVLRRLGGNDFSPLEHCSLAVSIGLGIIAYGVLALGLLGWLTTTAIATWLILSAAATWREWRLVLNALLDWPHPVRSTWKTLKTWQRLFLMAIGCIGVLTLLQALTPPWDYDGLMYHLQGPRLFLDAGRIEPLPEVWQANGPSTIEMLFTVGLALGTDTFAKLVHLTFGAILVLMTFNAGQRWLNPDGGWLAAGVLIGIPILPIWASSAYADLAWATYGFLALYALLIWRDQKRHGTLIAAGVLAGLALGSKYLALGGMAVLGFWLVVHSRASGVRTIIKRAAMFGAIAVLVGAPWYLKNWLLAGNPVYPMYWGGLGWSSERVAALMNYLQNYGTGRQWFDYVLSPINIYIQHARFATFQGSIEIPSLLFPLALLYPLIRSWPVLKIVAGVTLLQYGVWLLGSWQNRFLLPLFPNLSVLTAGVILGLVARTGRSLSGRVLATGLVAGLMAVTLVYQLIYAAQTGPFGVVIGAESKAAFLRRNVHDYAAWEFIQSKLPSKARVLLMWDGQSYYCGARCWPDAEQTRWTELVQVTQTVLGVAVRLQALGVTHLMFSNEGDAFLSEHDQTGRERLAADFFRREFQPTCAREVYRDQWAAVYERICP